MTKASEKRKARRTNTKPVNECNPDQETAMDMNAYSEKMGRWLSEALAAIKDPAFLATVHFIHKIKEPLDHFLHFLMQRKHTEDEDESALTVQKLCLLGLQTRW